MNEKDEKQNSTTENTLNDESNKLNEVNENKNSERSNDNNNDLNDLKDNNENKAEDNLEQKKDNQEEDKKGEKDDEHKDEEQKNEENEDKKGEKNDEEKGDKKEEPEEDDNKNEKGEEVNNEEKEENMNKNEIGEEDKKGEEHNEEENEIVDDQAPPVPNEENSDNPEEENREEHRQQEEKNEIHEQEIILDNDKGDNKNEEDNTEEGDKEDDNDEKENKEEEKKEKEEELEAPHKRSEYSLIGAKPPLSIYTRRVMDISKIDDYLNSSSARGQVGGRNLGNTCFMNSSIACLSNCTELTYYFLKGDYLKDINEENNLGMRGELAKEWGNLMKQYWVEDTRVGDPSDFKYTIGRKAERFRGYGQQDSNEFMSVFLDYLNEDLNRTTKKEYVELKEKSEEETDEECAKRFWEVNLRRNDSIVTDLFCGQFKSTITCPDCNWINITFDPFDAINLPLLTQIKRNEYGSSENVEEFKFFYIPKNVLRNPYCCIIKNVNNTEEIGKVIDRIAEEKDFIYHDKFNDLLVVDMLRKEKYGTAEKSQIVRQFVYDEEYLFSFDFDREKDEVSLFVYFFKNDTEKRNKSQYPRMIFCKNNDTLEEVRKKIYFYLRKYILSPFLKENEEKDEISLEIEKYMDDDNNELPDEKIYEMVENEYNKVFKKYDIDEKSKEEEEEKEKNDEDEDNRENEDKDGDEEKKEEEEKNEDENKEEEEEKKKEENIEGENKKEGNEEEEKEKHQEKNNEGEIKDETKPKEENDEEKTNKEENKINPADEKPEENKENSKKDQKASEEEYLKKCIERFKSDIPFEILIRRERDDNFYHGKIPFINSKNFSTYSKKLKEFLGIENFSEPLSSIQRDMSDYEIIVKFNENSKYINHKTFDLDYFNQISFEYTKKEKEEEKEEEKKDEEEDLYSGNMTLVKCLKKFCKEEQLTEGDEWYCPKCKKHVLAKKKLDLFYLPKILIICFKRFVKESYRWEKNEDEVEFPIHDFDLKDFVIGPDKNHSKYDLFAVSQHYGSTGFGHYTAVCQNYDGKWYSYDDSSCSETNESQTQSSAAYVLFYRRQTD